MNYGKSTRTTKVYMGKMFCRLGPTTEVKKIKTKPKKQNRRKDKQSKHLRLGYP